ncbi:hypothetical protein [Yoonia sp. SDW83-1]|uniref:hypothetical protein n=1 Tax=Yoonia sp. SDW83-1 TaxID=3366945 RepID=UPI00398C6093
MKAQSKGPTFVWLVLFAIRFFRDSTSGWRAFLWLWLATAFASVIASYHTTTLHITMQSEVVEPVLFSVTALFLVIAFAVDRMFHR